MESLKDKEFKSLVAHFEGDYENCVKKDKVMSLFRSKDVKEAVLDFEDWINLCISDFEEQKELKKKFKEIIGDFKDGPRKENE